MRNTKKAWVLRFMLFPSKKRGLYTAVCLDLALIREGRDAFKLYQQINKLAMRYVASIKKNNLSEELLNQQLPKIYIEKYSRLEEGGNKKIKEKWEKIMSALIWQQRISATRVSVSL